MNISGAVSSPAIRWIMRMFRYKHLPQQPAHSNEDTDTGDEKYRRPPEAAAHDPQHDAGDRKGAEAPRSELVPVSPYGHDAWFFPVARHGGVKVVQELEHAAVCSVDEQALFPLEHGKAIDTIDRVVLEHEILLVIALQFRLTERERKREVNGAPRRGGYLLIGGRWCGGEGYITGVEGSGFGTGRLKRREQAGNSVHQQMRDREQTGIQMQLQQQSAPVQLTSLAARAFISRDRKQWATRGRRRNICNTELKARPSARR